jgi:hypothetical protein
VNCAGINPVYGSLLDVDAQVATKMVDTNVLAALDWVKACRDAWMGEHGGAVVNLSSVAALAPSPGIGWYGATKAMVSRLTSELAVELAPAIRVNAVAPAVVKTRFAGALYDGREEKVAAAYPLKRLGEPEDVASLVWFLLSDQASWDHRPDHHHRRRPDVDRRSDPVVARPGGCRVPVILPVSHSGERIPADPGDGRSAVRLPRRTRCGPAADHCGPCRCLSGDSSARRHRVPYPAGK